MLSPRRHLLPLLVAATAIAPASASAADCPGADQRPSSGADLRAATVCVLNAERTSRGLDPLKANQQLDVAALAWSTRMVAEGFFAHEAADSTLQDRVTASGYLPAQKWRIGENLAWGELDMATPTHIVADWMASPGHRANMLDPNFRDVGIGIVLGRPGAPTVDAATYTADFGAVTKATTATKTESGDDTTADVSEYEPDADAKPTVIKPAEQSKAKKKAKKAKPKAKKKLTRKQRAALKRKQRAALKRKLRMAGFASHQQRASR